MIYLDNAATSWPKAPDFAQAWMKVCENPIGNVGRSAHEAAYNATKILYDCRKALQRVMPPTALEKTIFTKGATESLNIALSGLIEEHAVVLTSSVEHNAVARVLYALNTRNITLVFAPTDAYGSIDPDGFERMIESARPHVAVFTAAGNVNGAVNPVHELIMRCAAHNIPFVIDGAQGIGEMPQFSIPGDAEGVLCFSLHKGLLGPTGVGVMALYGTCNPNTLLFGGTGSNSDSEVQPETLPDKFESGTPAIHAIGVANHCIDFYAEHIDEIEARRRVTSQMLYDGLSEFRQLRILSPHRNRVGIVSVTTKDGTISMLARKLYQSGIAIRSGFHCAPWAHRFFNTLTQGGALRFSVGYTTTEDDIRATLHIVGEALHE